MRGPINTQFITNLLFTVFKLLRFLLRYFLKDALQMSFFSFVFSTNSNQFTEPQKALLAQCYM